MDYRFKEAVKDLVDAVWEKIEPPLLYVVEKLQNLLTKRH